jgi:phospholipid/cholesterol/gamma-HCH transport system substrate-binding protein
MMSDLQSRRFPQKADDAMNGIKSAVSNIDESSQQLNRIMAQVMKPDEEGADAADNLRESLSNANLASGNLVDDTEAFKHNVLVRGFFRSRGYYSLTNMPPDKYRADKAFTNPANHRAWLPATELFQAGASGIEELSPQGKLLLDATVTQLGDSALDGPIVVEGYADNNDPATQLTQARNRAILVSQYLQNRLDVEPSNLGVVSMKNLPPAGVGHSTWDGVCLVALKRR